MTLAAEHGTAAYVLDEDDFRSRAREFRDSFATAFERLAGADVYYAGKAFLCTAVARWVAEEGLHLDVCTGGELAVAQRAGFPAERIGFHGNNKTDRRAPRGAVLRRRAASSSTPSRRSTASPPWRPSSACVAPVMVRVTVGVEAHTHEFIATGHEDQKFGFSLAGGQRRGGRTAHPGPAATSSTCAGCTATSAARSSTPAASRRRRTGSSACTPGSPTSTATTAPRSTSAVATASPTPRSTPPCRWRRLAEEMADIVERELKAVGDGDTPHLPRVSVEPGRAIVGPSTFTLYEVGTVKDVELGGGHLAHLRLASTAG